MRVLLLFQEGDLTFMEAHCDIAKQRLEAYVDFGSCWISEGWSGEQDLENSLRYWVYRRSTTKSGLIFNTLEAALDYVTTVHPSSHAARLLLALL